MYTICCSVEEFKNENATSQFSWCCIESFLLFLSDGKELCRRNRNRYCFRFATDEMVGQTARQRSSFIVNFFLSPLFFSYLHTTRNFPRQFLLSDFETRSTRERAFRLSCSMSIRSSSRNLDSATLQFR